MIPAGYAAALVAWATRPDLTDEQRAARRQSLLDEHDSLVTGQLGGKASRTLTSGTLNGKAFTWSADMTTVEKLSVLTQVLGQLGLVAPAQPSAVFAVFSDVRR